VSVHVDGDGVHKDKPILTSLKIDFCCATHKHRQQTSTAANLFCAKLCFQLVSLSHFAFYPLSFFWRNLFCAAACKVETAFVPSSMVAVVAHTTAKWKANCSHLMLFRFFWGLRISTPAPLRRLFVILFIVEIVFPTICCKMEGKLVSLGARSV